MKILKKTAIILTAAITMGSITNMPFTLNTVVSASTTDLAIQISGDWCYSIFSDGTVVIREYKGNAETVIIPSQINGRTVVEIGDNALLGSTYPVDVKKEVIIPNTIK